MENLVYVPKTKRIQCYNCHNYINLKQKNENSFSGHCKKCGVHIVKTERAKQTLIRIVHA